MHRRMNNIVILLSLLCIFEFVWTFTSDELRVTLSNGSKLVGRYLRSHSGRPIRGFTSIPFAKPPIGSLRFKVYVQRIQNIEIFFFKLTDFNGWTIFIGTGTIRQMGRWISCYKRRCNVFTKRSIHSKLWRYWHRRLFIFECLCPACGNFQWICF